MMALVKATVSKLNKCVPRDHCNLLRLVCFNLYHTTHQSLVQNDQRPKKYLALRSFDSMEHKERESYLAIIREYQKVNLSDYGHLQFIITALKYMDVYGVNKDREVYKMLLGILPKGKYIPQNIYQRAFQHYPKHQQTVVDLLHKMEYNGVLPDREMEEMLINIFGEGGLPVHKYWRMTYWMPKFARLNPWPALKPIDQMDTKEIATHAINKLGSVDVQSITSEFQTKDITDAIDDTWIMSTMSKTQEQLLSVQPLDRALSVEGPFYVWFLNARVDYFVLKGPPLDRKIIDRNIADFDLMDDRFSNRMNICIPHTFHEQNDGTYYAMCATGTSTKDSLLSWIRCLQEKNPVLKTIPIVFKLYSNTQESDVIHKISDGKEMKDKEENSDSQAQIAMK